MAKYEIDILTSNDERKTISIANSYQEAIIQWRKSKSKFPFNKLWLINQCNRKLLYYYKGIKRKNKIKYIPTIKNKKYIKVKKRSGNWTVEKYRDDDGKITIVVTNGYFLDYPYKNNNGKIIYKDEYLIPKPIIKYLKQNYNKLMK